MTVDELIEKLHNAEKSNSEYWESWSAFHGRLYGLVKPLRKAEEAGFAPSSLLKNLEDALVIVEKIKNAL